MKKYLKKNIESYNRAVDFYEKEISIRDIEKILIKKYFRGKILDLGCGCGRTTKYLFDEGYNVIGVDIIENMIKTARKKYPEIIFEVGDACKLNFKDNSFDTVFFSFNGLDYIYPESNRIIAIKEIERVLKPSSFFVFSSHNSLSLFFSPRPRFFLRNILRGTLFSRYKLDKESFGELYTYYASPEKQISLIEKNTSPKFVEMKRKKINSIYPHYVFQKNKL